MDIKFDGKRVLVTGAGKGSYDKTYKITFAPAMTQISLRILSI